MKRKVQSVVAASRQSATISNSVSLRLLVRQSLGDGGCGKNPGPPTTFEILNLQFEIPMPSSAPRGYPLSTNEVPSYYKRCGGRVYLRSQSHQFSQIASNRTCACLKNVKNETEVRARRSLAPPFWGLRKTLAKLLGRDME